MKSWLFAAAAAVVAASLSAQPASEADLERYDHFPALFSLNAPNTDSKHQKRRFADHLEASLDNPCARNNDTDGLHFYRHPALGWSLTKPDFGAYRLEWIFSLGLKEVTDDLDVLYRVLEEHAGGRDMVRWDAFFECASAVPATSSTPESTNYNFNDVTISVESSTGGGVVLRIPLAGAPGEEPMTLAMNVSAEGAQKLLEALARATDQARRD